MSSAAEQDTKTLDAIFFDYISICIDEAGFFPYPGMSKDASGKLSLAAITTPELALKWFWNAVLVDKESEVIFWYRQTRKTWTRN